MSFNFIYYKTRKNVDSFLKQKPKQWTKMFIQLKQTNKQKPLFQSSAGFLKCFNAGYCIQRSDLLCFVFSWLIGSLFFLWTDLSKTVCVFVCSLTWLLIHEIQQSTKSCSCVSGLFLKRQTVASHGVKMLALKFKESTEQVAAVLELGHCFFTRTLICRNVSEVCWSEWACSFAFRIL